MSSSEASVLPQPAPSGPQAVSGLHQLAISLDLAFAGFSAEDVTITVYNGVDEIVHRGAGPATLSLPKGLYTVRAEFAGEIYEQVVRHDQATPVSIAPERHASAPVEGAATSYEYYSETSSRLSREVTGPPLGRVASESGGLFIFIRAANQFAHGGQDLRQDLSLRSPRDGQLLSAFEADAQANTTYGYLAYSVQAEPGVYILDYAGSPSRQMPIYVYRNWQTQIFVTHHKRPRLEGATILLGQNGFNPSDNLPKIIDMAISGLQNNVDLLPQSAMWELLNAKFSNPMLGLLGAHLLLRRKETEYGAVDMVLGNLGYLLPDSPDVRALYLMKALRDGNQGALDNMTFDTPPMFRAGFSAAIAADADHEGILPDRGWLEQVAPLVYTDSPWTTWAPLPPSLVPDALPMDDQSMPYQLFSRGGNGGGAGGPPQPDDGWLTQSLAEAVERASKTGQPPDKVLRKFAADFNVPLRLVKRAYASLAPDADPLDTVSPPPSAQQVPNIQQVPNTQQMPDFRQTAVIPRQNAPDDFPAPESPDPTAQTSPTTPTSQTAQTAQMPASDTVVVDDEAQWPQPRAWQPGPPVYRRLRGYALDPGLAHQFETAPISQITFQVPWEPLAPGPVGEYLEVIDHDPAGKCFYEPVDLDQPFLLAQNGLPPAEGTPQFHQQMVYAVASLTIHNFERALGRKALWSPGPSPSPNNPADDSHYVQRLRIYPHALRETNAYYSPAKKALLFGYFPAAGDGAAEYVPGSMVFTCLSHDIIAHETAHALLDGLHRRLNRATNPDMLAFHEAFADIVALFQHFTFPEILRHQIARTRGDIHSQETLLGQLAGQFGRATGTRSALRDAIGRIDPDTGKWAPHPVDPAEYARTLQPHRRGAILVAAVFDAFLTIYNNRTSDLRRLYTGGSGVLPAGAVHPDLIERLADEASKAANHVLSMCVRALDYCPPVDLTFGEYLRAIITADADLVRNDDRNYRVAFVEAFRRRGIFPRGVRALSAENLVWRSSQIDSPRPSEKLVEIFTSLREFGQSQLYATGREQLFRQARAARGALHGRLRAHFKSGPQGSQDAAFLGLDAGQDGSFEVHSVHFASRVGPDAELQLQAVLQITQQRAPEPGQGSMPFEGGSTVVVDLKAPAIAYCIRKPITSSSRSKRQADFDQQFAASTLHATYFGGQERDSRREPFALLHRAGG